MWPFWFVAVLDAPLENSRRDVWRLYGACLEEAGREAQERVLSHARDDDSRRVVTSEPFRRILFLASAAALAGEGMVTTGRRTDAGSEIDL